MYALLWLCYVCECVWPANSQCELGRVCMTEHVQRIMPEAELCGKSLESWEASAQQSIS